MPRNVYWELFYHLIWRTKDSVPQITQIEDQSPEGGGAGEGR